MSLEQSRFPIKLALAFVALIPLALGIWAAQIHRAPPDVSGVLFPQPRALSTPDLLFASGEPFSLSKLQGRPTVVFLGFAHCPDICPMTLQMLSQAHQRLRTELGVAMPFNVLFVTADPARDTADLLGRYLGHFNTNFLAVTGEVAAITALTQQLGLLFNLPDAPSDDYYAVDHSASLAILNPDAHFSAVLRQGFTSDSLEQDLRSLIKYWD